MTMLQKIRGSFTAQLTLWVAGFVIAIFGVVMFLLARFSQQVVVDESIETTMQLSLASYFSQIAVFFINVRINFG